MLKWVGPVVLMFFVSRRMWGSALWQIYGCHKTEILLMRMDKFYIECLVKIAAFELHIVSICVIVTEIWQKNDFRLVLDTASVSHTYCGKLNVVKMLFSPPHHHFPLEFG